MTLPIYCWSKGSGEVEWARTQKERNPNGEKQMVVEPFILVWHLFWTDLTYVATMVSNMQTMNCLLSVLDCTVLTLKVRPPCFRYHLVCQFDNDWYANATYFDLQC